MAVEKIVYGKDFIGTFAEMGAMDKKGIVPGSTYWAWDTRTGYTFAAGDWRLI
jgi:hypothetical protein